jgi:hypothetical protein
LIAVSAESFSFPHLYSSPSAPAAPRARAADVFQNVATRLLTIMFIGETVLTSAAEHRSNQQSK